MDAPIVSVAKRSAALIVLIALTAPAAGEEGGQIPQLAPGMRVRVSAAGIADSPFVGTIGSLDDRSISLRVRGRADPLTVPREKILRLDLSAGKRSRWTGTLIGAALGGVAGGLAGRTSSSYTAANEAGGAVLGVLVGGLVGFAIPPGYHWNEVPATRYRVSLAPRFDHKLGAAFAVAF
jgi:hypothetical protein